MAANVNTGDDEMITGINVTPLVDIVLVLLVILMVTASYVASKTIPMDLPNAATGGDVPTTLAVSIDQSGQLYLDAVPVSRSELQRRVAAAHHADADTRATIAADGRVSHAQVVDVIDVLRREDIVKFAINVDPTTLAREGN
jgi:biopolymer transport protein ExbD